MPQFAVIALREIPPQGTTASGALVWRSPVVADAGEAVSLFANDQQPLDSLKIWTIPVGQLTPYRIDVTKTQAVVAE